MDALEDVSGSAVPVPNWLFIACGLSWGAGLIHVGAAIGHVHESRLYALCFAPLAPLQIAWGLLACRRCSGRLLLAGCLFSVLVVSVWILSRTVGLPVGPEPWHPEAVGAADSLASADEVSLALLVWAYALPGAVGGVRLRVGRGTCAVAVVLVVLSSLALLGAGHTS